MSTAEPENKKKKRLKTDAEKEYEISLIAEIKRRPFLYDKTLYCESQLRIDAWEELANKYNKTVKQLKKKWETLRDNYRRHNKKVQADHEGKISVKWWHYERLKFLDGHIKMEETPTPEQNEMQKEFDTKLIAEVTKYKNIFDPMSETYRNMKERADTWDKISTNLNASVEMCKKRWKYSRDTFRKFYKKESKDNKEISWIHYNSLKFLSEYESINMTDIKPPHIYNPSKPEIPLDLKTLPSLNDDMILKSEKENESLDSIEYNDIFVETKPDLFFDLPQKCGEIMISKTESFSYKCSVCSDVIEDIDGFTKHVLDNHMGRNETISIFEIKSPKKNEDNDIESNYSPVNMLDINDSDGEETPKKNVESNVITKKPLKYIKNEVKKSLPTEEELKENPDDDPETAALKRLKRQRTNIKLEKIGKYPCTFCSYSFDKEENLKKHLETHQPAAPHIYQQKKKQTEFFPCDECDRKFQYRHQLERHKRLHTGERPYQCTLCEQKFRHYYNLKEHYIFRHTDDKPYACRYDGCCKKFKTKKTRLSHEVIHSTDLPFQCDECGKCFPRNIYLKRHRTTWHMDKNDRPYKCPHCTKSFCTQQNLKYHIYTHTGERPFGCPICPSRFTKPWTIKSHMKIHTGERDYVCNICGKDFLQISGLIKHKKRHEVVNVTGTANAQ